MTAPGRITSAFFHCQTPSYAAPRATPGRRRHLKDCTRGHHFRCSHIHLERAPWPAAAQIVLRAIALCVVLALDCGHEANGPTRVRRHPCVETDTHPYARVLGSPHRCSLYPGELQRRWRRRTRACFLLPSGARERARSVCPWGTFPGAGVAPRQV